MRLLLIEGDADLRHALSRELTEAGFTVDGTADSVEAIRKAQDPAYRLVILGLSGQSGLDMVKELRLRSCTVPIVLLSDSSAETDRIQGLESGADAYLTKPVSFPALLAHVRGLLRRVQWSHDPVLRVGAITLDRARRIVQVGTERVELSLREFAVLELFMQNPGEVLTRARIYEIIWNEPLELKSNLIDAHMKDLRRKLAVAGAAEAITTIRGAGYRLEITPTRPAETE